MKISDSVKKRFVKDYNLPITLFRQDLFEYFMELYDKSMDTSGKWNKLVSILEELGEEGFFKESSRIIDAVVAEISSHQSYLNIQNMTLPTILPTPTAIRNTSIYQQDYIGKLMLSIDMRQANFNALRYISPELLRNEKDYVSYLKNFTKYSYFLESKQIRQVIFGNLNPKRQQSIQKYIMSLALNALAKKYSGKLELVVTGPDEIVIVYDEVLGLYIYQLIDEIKVLLEVVPTLPVAECYNISPFILERVDCNKSFYVKVPYDLENERAIAFGEDVVGEYNVWDVEFKKVPSYFYPQVYKKYFKIPICDNDMMFYHEGHYAKFLTGVCDNNLTEDDV